MTKTWYWYPRLPLPRWYRKKWPKPPIFGKQIVHQYAQANSKCEYQTDLFGLAASKKLRIKYTNKHRLWDEGCFTSLNRTHPLAQPFLEFQTPLTNKVSPPNYICIVTDLIKLFSLATDPTVLCPLWAESEKETWAIEHESIRVPISSITYSFLSIGISQSPFSTFL